MFKRSINYGIGIYFLFLHVKIKVAQKASQFISFHYTSDIYIYIYPIYIYIYPIYIYIYISDIYIYIYIGYIYIYIYRIYIYIYRIYIYIYIRSVMETNKLTGFLCNFDFYMQKQEIYPNSIIN